MIFRKTWIIIFLFIFAGCLKPSVEKKYASFKKIDFETNDKINIVLNKVESLSKTNDLDYLGRSTMNESVEVLDCGAAVSSIIIHRLKISENWKFRYWLVDILGYLGSPENVIALVEVIEDNTEKILVRLRACDSISELNYRHAIKHLNIAETIVKDKVILEKIAETIRNLR